MTRSFVTQAQAKVNLVIEVLRRGEKHHDIVSIAQTISTHDRLTFEEHTDISFTCNQPSLLDDNLVVAAARLLRERTGVHAGASIHLDKRIPWGAGLGGGSSDAATTLSALNDLWGCGLATEALMRLGAELGADVPLFLQGGTVLLGGNGSVVSPLPQMAKTHLVLLVPGSVGARNKTGALYSRLDQGQFTKGQFARAAAFSLERKGAIPEDLMFNAFESVALEFFPGLRDDREAFSARTGKQVHLAGSGPCLYALCADAEEATQIEEDLRRAGLSARVAHTTGPLGTS